MIFRASYIKLLLHLLFDCFLNHASVHIHTSWLIKHFSSLPLVENWLEIRFELLPRYVPLSDNFTISFMVSTDPKFKFIIGVGDEFNVYGVIRVLSRITTSSIDKSPTHSWDYLCRCKKIMQGLKYLPSARPCFKYPAICVRFCMQSIQYFRHPLYKFRIREDVVLYLLPARSMKYARAPSNFIWVASLLALRFYSQIEW